MSRAFIIGFTHRVYGALLFVTAVILFIGYFMEEGDLRVTRPDWTQSNIIIDPEIVSQYVETGAVVADDPTGPPLAFDTPYAELLQYNVLYLEGQPPIERYIDRYVVKPGKNIYFLREVESSEVYKVVVSRISQQVGVSPAPPPKAYGTVSYTAKGIRETREFRYEVDICTPPGDYIYSPDGTYEVNFMGQSVLKRKYTVKFPAIKYTVLEPETVDINCMANNRHYRSYFMKKEKT